MADKIIQVGLNQPDRSGNQTLRLHDPQGNDLFTADVKPGDNIIWQLESGVDIDSLEGISGSAVSNLFERAPSKQADGSYFATIKSAGVNDGQIDPYDISYKRSANGGGLLTEQGPKLKNRLK